MIYIKDKKECCGCSACVQKCPKQCISLQEDNEGFLYPIVDKETCINCGLCEKVCPVLHQNQPRKTLKAYAAINKNEEIRLQSSSGGVFTLLAEKIINEGGVVFGARFDDNWEVKHDYTDTIEGLAAFRGSKYVQSRIEDNFQKAENFLKEGHKVLFSGTPCQIAGLKRYLRKEYENLLTIDIICHGVPSPKVWNMYLKETCFKLLKNKPNETEKSVSQMDETYKSCIEAISFRSKITGWKKYSFMLQLKTPDDNNENAVVFAEPFAENIFMRAFLSDIILRPSCYECPAKQGKSHSDITIADFWGIDKIDPAFDDDKGCSAILLNTEKGELCYPVKQIQYENKSLNDVILYNFAYYKNSKPHPMRKKFFMNLGGVAHLSQYIPMTLKPTMRQKITKKINLYTKAIFRRIGITK